MNPYLSQLLAALKPRENAENVELSEKLASLPEPDEGVSPWAAWLLVCLIRHHERQLWLAHTIQSRLQADLTALAAVGYLGHPDVPGHGLVPGLTDWEYYFHGIGCCLTHRITGESLDVDFYDQTGDWFDVYFYINYLKSLKAPEFAEHRLIKLHPSLETLRLAFEELLEADLLVQHPESRMLRLHPDGFLLEDKLDSLEDRWNQPQERILVAAALGDWLLVEQELQTMGSPLPKVSARASRCRHLRFHRLKGLYEPPDSPPEVLAAIADLDHPELPGLLERALQGRPCGTMSVALRIITARSEPRWIKTVHQLFRRLNPNGEIPEPHIWKICRAVSGPK